MWHSTHLILLSLLSITAAVTVYAVDLEVNGGKYEVNAYPDGTLRLRLRATPDAYEVSDVVVGSEAEGIVTTGCEPDGLCWVKHGSAELQLRPITDNADAGSGATSVTYRVDGVVRTTSTVRMEGSAPRASFGFPGASHLYGIPERAVDIALKADTEYRLMNLDVFKYKLDDPGGVYGTIPFLMAHGAASGTTAVLFLNSADSKVRVVESNGVRGAEWSCESGIHDIFYFSGSTPTQVQKTHAAVVGPTLMPPLFALGYHQCRWNYRSTNDALEVDEGFDKHNIPYDVLWLDIEHTDGKRYFTWDPHTFGDHQRLTSTLAANNRKLVTITDPHIKRDPNYHVHKEATEQGFYVKTASGSDFEGHCWPGQSSWIDFYNANARKWYATLFKYDRYVGSTPIVYSWIDMNEPSVFNAHEVTMDKNAVHHTAGGKSVAHRDLHNMYGYYHTMAAYDGHMLRSAGPPHDKQTRPFILTRSFFSGSQRYAAMWTGDNAAEWGHLQKSIPMLLALSVSNYIFVGADIGGFFDNPSTELLVRWYQAAIFTPFLRGHAHLETKRREPWLSGEPATTQIRNALALRYTLLPYLYTTFSQAHQEGGMVIRPMFFEAPTEPRFFTEQNTYMFGPSLLVRPVVEEGATQVTVDFPTATPWFHFPSGEPVAVGTATASLPVTMDSMPVFVKGGRIVPTRNRMRRNSAAAVNDPITLYVAADGAGNAEGELYLDDTHSFEYQQGSFLKVQFALEGFKTLRAVVDSGNFQTPVIVERVVLIGMSTAPTSAMTDSGVSIPVAPGSAWSTVVRQPQLPVQSGWTLTFE